MENAATKSRTVLVVDDECVVRMHAVDLLEHAGYRVVEAAGADEALMVLERHPEISVLFTDINMPGPDGFELARAVHALRPDIHLILTSAVARAAAQIPADTDFIGKPYSALQVVRIIEDAAPTGPLAVQTLRP